MLWVPQLLLTVQRFHAVVKLYLIVALELHLVSSKSGGGMTRTRMEAPFLQWFRTNASMSAIGVSSQSVYRTS